ncbi:MAG: hypothetical protein M1415_02415 [Firmicutes bacterium]|jgi:hypothetical protein|nr:hypothetical protein [Bacillota bacterium]
MTDPLIVAIPTHDLRAIVPTMLELGLVSEQLNRPLHFAIGEASNIPRSRNVVLQQLRDAYPQTPNLWVLWLDSDIVLFPGYTDAIVAGIQWAEVHNCGIVANYRMANGENVLIANKEGPPYRHYTTDELDTLPNYAEVGLAGLGFAYFRQPLEYVFHADNVGEDIHLWWDHPELTLCWAKQIRVGHKKLVLLR